MTYNDDHPVPSGCAGQVFGLLLCALIAAGLIWLASYFHVLGF